MYAYEIENFKSKKIRRKEWKGAVYTYIDRSGKWAFAGESITDMPLSCENLSAMITQDDWEEYEPKKPEVITVYEGLDKGCSGSNRSSLLSNKNDSWQYWREVKIQIDRENKTWKYVED